MKIQHMPLYLQGKKTAYCVPYSAAAIAHWYGSEHTLSQVVRIFRTSKTRGTTMSDIPKGFSELGFKLKPIAFTTKNVRKSIKARKPIVITYASEKFEGHFSTIIGLTRRYGMVYYILNDTYFGEYEIPEKLLMILMARDVSISGSSRIWARQVVKK